MRPKYEYRTASKETYNRFCVANPKTQISFEEFKEISYAYLESFRDYIIETGDVCKLPYGFGYFTICRKKISRYKTYKGVTYVNLPVDWKATKAEGKKVYHFNFHTDGYRCKWLWYKDSARLAHRNIFIFLPSRSLSRKLASELNKPDSSHFQIYREIINKKLK